MAETEQVALSDLLTQKRELDRQVAAHEIAPTRATLETLTGPAAVAYVEALKAHLEALPAGHVAHTQVTNAVKVLVAVPNLVRREVDRLQALIDAE